LLWQAQWRAQALLLGLQPWDQQLLRAQALLLQGLRSEAWAP
jgi:hypothetical protein